MLFRIKSAFLGRLSREIQVFKTLSPQSQALLLCSFLFRFAAPFVGIFLNLYLWRQTNDLRTLIFYNVAVYAGLPLGFIANGYLLKRVPVGTLFPLGLLSQMILPILVIILQQSIIGFVIPLGVICGFGAAFYWANYNYLTFALNNDNNRGYFIGLDSSLNSFVSVSAPVIAGVVIADKGYYWCFLVAVLIYIIGGLVARKHIRFDKTINFGLGKAATDIKSPNWQKVRMLLFVWGVLAGATLFSGSVLAYLFVSHEFGVGLINGIGGAAGVLGGYLGARYVVSDRRLRSAAFGTVALVLGALVFGISPVFVAYLFFIVISQIGGSFVWPAEYSLILREMDYGHPGPENKYHYVVDNEIFMDLGRIITVLLFLPLLSFLSYSDVLRAAILSTAALWVLNFLLIKQVLGATLSPE